MTALGAAWLAWAACAPPPAEEPLPDAAVATGVEAVGPGWSAAAATLRFTANEAHATEPAVVRSAPGKPPLEIVADRSDWDLRGRTARFSGHVRARRAAVELRCETLDVRYADAERIDTVVASGGVDVSQAGRSAHATTAELDGATGKITLRGEPRLVEGPNTLVGSELVLWLDDDRATCTGAEGAPCRLVVDGAALE